MPKFDPGVEVVTEESAVAVEVDPQAPLPKGVHVFQLVVVDDDGLASDPMTIEVVVRDDRKPTAVLRGPGTVGFGQSFRLDGSESSDLPPGQVVKYQWTMLK